MDLNVKIIYQKIKILIFLFQQSSSVQILIFLGPASNCSDEASEIYIVNAKNNANGATKKRAENLERMIHSLSVIY